MKWIFKESKKLFYIYIDPLKTHLAAFYNSVLVHVYHFMRIMNLVLVLPTKTFLHLKTTFEFSYETIAQCY